MLPPVRNLLVACRVSQSVRHKHQALTERCRCDRQRRRAIRESLCWRRDVEMFAG